MARFEIHQQLLTDSHQLGRFPLCHLLLHKNAIVPWFILVPQTECIDLLDLPENLRTSVIDEASRMASFIKQNLNYPKVNFAAIGNVVPQLHLHIVGRKPGDACWPHPVWGHLTQTTDYQGARIRELTAALVKDYGLRANESTG